MTGPWDPSRTEILPVLAVGDRVLLPGMRCTVALTTVAALGAVKEAGRSFGQPTVAVFGAPPATVGTLATATGLRRVDCGHWAADVHAHARARRHGLLREEPFPIATVERLVDPGGVSGLAAALAARIRLAVTAAHGCFLSSERLDGVVRALKDAPAEEVVGVVAPLLGGLSNLDLQRMLELDGLDDRLACVLAHLRPSDALRSAPH